MGIDHRRFFTRVYRLAPVLDIELSKLFLTVGMWTLYLMGCIVALDVVMRYVFNSPLRGAWEIVELSLVVVVFASIAHAYMKKLHVSIDILLLSLPQKIRLMLSNITAFLGLLLFILIVAYSFLDYLKKIEIHMQSMILGVPHAPFALLVPVGCTLLCFMLFRDLLKNTSEARRLNFEKGQWFMMYSTTFIVAALAALWAIMSPHFDLDPLLIAVISFPVVFAFIAIGMPVAFSLLMGGVLFLPSTSGSHVALIMAGRELFSTTGTANWAIMGLFTMMGYFIYYSRLGEDLFRMANNWLGFMPGGLAMATVGGSTAIAACAGGSMSSSIVMGTVAYPEMKRYGYSETLSTGVICSGATLGPLIPPSIPLVFYGLLTKQSIGTLFVAAVIPGIMLALVFLITVFLWCKANPGAGRGIPPSPWRERLSSAVMVLPVLFLFVLVIGGIYGGIFTPTEAGGIAAFAAFGIALAMRRITWKVMNNALRDSALMTCAIMLMIAGGKVYSYFIIASGLGARMAEIMTGLQVTPLMLAAIFLGIYLIMGCFMDIIAVILITIPVFLPIAETVHLDLIWFGVLMTIICNLGLITPPFGPNLFLLKMVNRDIPMIHIYRGVIPFVISTVALAILIFLFPSIVTWLPNLMKG
ncbi:MAG: TRAP transporter large permease subunit [Deltaproteobacteria bacterium]|nr:TRAP transporter large permease subunit [Deltaproteobacteria bacterium]